MSNEKIVLEIKKILEKLRPYLNSEGGDIEFIRYEDGLVYIRMLGACVDCQSLDFTLKDGIESMLVEEIPEVIGVVNVLAE